MPFASQKQRAFMYSQHPKIAARWRKESGPQKGLPEYSRGHLAPHDRIRRMIKKAMTSK